MAETKTDEVPRPTTLRIAELQRLGYTWEDLCFGKYFKAVNKIGITVLEFTFKIIYQSLKTDFGRMSIRDYCLNELKWSTSNYNKIFFTAEREITKLSPLHEDFVCDISLWFKLIMNLLGTHVEPIKKSIRELKNLRNAVCHDNLQMDDQSLQERLEKLGDMCRDILEGAQYLVHGQSRVSMSNVINEVENSLRDLMTSKIGAGDINSYLDDLNKFREKKTSKMISEGRKELMSIYSKVKILNPCPWLHDSCFSDFTIENTFTSLTLQESITEVSLNDILNQSRRKHRFVPQVVIVSGVMGAGKTSLYRYLLHEWCNRSSTVVGLSDVDIVIGMEMRWLTSRSLAQFLREQLLIETSRLFNKSDIIPVLQEVNVVFIIDGIDEATHLGYDLLREIITKFTNSTILVTTRPEFTLEVMKMAEEHVVLQIQGFTPENQEKYVEKVFAFKYLEKRRFHKEAKAFMAYKNSVCAALSTHLSLPLNLALLVMLWCDDYLKVTAVTTTTRLYSKLYELSQQKLAQRLQSGGVGHSATVSLKVHRFFIELGRVAWTMMREETLCITHSYTVNLMEFCESEGMDPIQALSTFLNSEMKETLTSTVCNFSFHHTSSIEFLAACYVTEEAVKSGSLFPLLLHIRTPKFQETLMYITGLLKMKEALTCTFAAEIKEALTQCIKVQINDPQVLHRLIQEADGDSALSKIISPIITSEECWVINSWDPPELTEAKRVLMKETRAAPHRVYIYTQYMRKLQDCPQLVDVIKLLEKITTTKVKVFVERQFHTVDEEEQVDILLVPLLKNNSLLEVVAHIGPSFASELRLATNIQSLSVRITSLETLWNMSLSMRKHREWKAKVMPSKKWSLKYLELFLNISNTTPPCDFPYLHYGKELLLRLTGLTDEEANWAGQVVKRMSRRYACVILQASHISPVGLKQFLKASEDVKIKVFRVMSDQIDLSEMIKAERQGMRIEVGML